MHAEKCPVCNGTGKYEAKQCHGCAGQAWVEVSDGSQTIVYIPQPYQPYQPYIPYVDPVPWQPIYGGTGDQMPPPQYEIYWSGNVAQYEC